MEGDGLLPSEIRCSVARVFARVSLIHPPWLAGHGGFFVYGEKMNSHQQLREQLQQQGRVVHRQSEGENRPVPERHSLLPSPSDSRGPVIRVSRAPAYLGISRAAMYLKMREGSRHFDSTFAVAFSLSTNTRCFLVADLDAWIASKAAQRSKGDDNV